MEKEYYYVYCNGILGVKTNVCDFKWIYGSVAPCVSSEMYQKCAIRFDVCIKNEKHISQLESWDRRFHAYTWDEESQTICCRRKLFGYLEIGYLIQIKEDGVIAQIGSNYYRFVKNRMMNLHGIYYLLSDLANILLLRNGYLSLYASAVYYDPMRKCAVNFAPPNTGKTFTASKLCQRQDYHLVGEDIVISDGRNIYACPWTSSYRSNTKGILDSSGSLNRHDTAAPRSIKEECAVSEMMVLVLGNKKISMDKERILKSIVMLNGYVFNYYSSPIVKMLGFFNDKYNWAWNDCAKFMLCTMADNCRCFEIQAEESVDFAKIIHRIISGETL